MQVLRCPRLPLCSCRSPVFSVCSRWVPPTCPATSADLSEILFIGKYRFIGNTLNTFENFSFVNLSDIIWPSFNPSTERLFIHTTSKSCFSGFQSMFIIDPVKGHAVLTVNCDSVAVQVIQASSGSSESFNIHPSSDSTRCVGILGGLYTDCTAVDMYVTLLLIYFTP